MAKNLLLNFFQNEPDDNDDNDNNNNDDNFDDKNDNNDKTTATLWHENNGNNDEDNNEGDSEDIDSSIDFSFNSKIRKKRKLIHQKFCRPLAGPFKNFWQKKYTQKKLNYFNLNDQDVFSLFLWHLFRGLIFCLL